MKVNEAICGFVITAHRCLPELDAQLYEMEHERTGARLVWLDRKDDNKTFGIAFRTVPEDDTGVFHILEHSVLCGSDRYPVKEPFVELMKGSMKTFLNAMTFPDKTFYPVSSRNPKDFLNLVRVYMDAVLHPLIYSRPEIFWQEGWHYEFPDDTDHPVYTGVVFNEMKGMFSSPDMLMETEIRRRLFPDTYYQFVAGGEPTHIPELTYAQFLDSHRRFYHPSNAYIYLDGQMDIEEILSILDGEYLKGYQRQDLLPELPTQMPIQSEPTRIQYELSPNEPTEGKARMAWGYVLGDYTCREEQVAMQVLGDVLCGGNEAPLKRRLLSAGLAQNVFLSVIDGTQQPHAVLEVRNIDESRADEIDAVVHEELLRLVTEGLDHDHLAATLANMEFQLRERDFGQTPQGLGLGYIVLSSWLYGGNPVANLEVGELFHSLNQKLEKGYFEKLLKQMLLENPHNCQVTLLPSHTFGQEKRKAETTRLREARESWSETEEAFLRQQQAALFAWQSAPDTPQALETLPMLKLSDVSPQPEDIPLEADVLCGVPLLRHKLSTGGIGYYHLYFDISDLTEEELPVLALLSILLGGLDTVKSSSLELQKLCRLYLGNLYFNIEAYSRTNEPDSCRIFLCASFSAVEDKLPQAVSLVTEILTQTQFDDVQKLRELLRQELAYMEQGVVSAGQSFAITRVSAGLSAEGLVREYTGGITYCQWLKRLEKDFDSRVGQLCTLLQALCSRIFDTGRLTVSITGTENDAALENVLFAKLSQSQCQELPCKIHPWGLRKEGILIPADVSFAAMGGSLLAHDARYSGSTRVMGRIVSLAYLWNAVRIQGGAYGTGLALGNTGNACFYSYRDPNGARSLDSYRQTAGFLEQFCAAQPDLTGFIVGAVAESDPLMLPKMQGKHSDSLYFKDISYADQCRMRHEILEMSPQTLADFAQPLRTLTENGSVCVIGSQQQIDTCRAELDDVISL